MLRIPPMPSFFDTLKEGYSMTPEFQLALGSMVATLVEETLIDQIPPPERNNKASFEEMQAFVNSVVSVINQDPKLHKVWSKMTLDDRMNILKLEARRRGYRITK